MRSERRIATAVRHRRVRAGALHEARKRISPTAWRRCAATWLPVVLAIGPALVADATRAVAVDAPDFERQVRPILVQRCVGCHGPARREGGLRLDLRPFALRGGDGGRVIVPGRSGASELLRRISSTDRNDFMPPKGDRLPPAQIVLLKTWIDAGAVWPETDADRAAVHDGRLDHWAWRPIAPPAVPAPISDDWSRTEIDRFLRAKLKEQGLNPSPAADPRTLIRRVTFDLIGLPPTPEEVDAFVRECAAESPAGSDDVDRSPPDFARPADSDKPAGTRRSAYGRLVERLLRSPHHGERWARHWLDVVHYGDTHGYDKDKPRPNAWPYRDYVIRAFDEDKPYARFVAEQVAGDVLWPGSRDGIEALGFLAAGPWDFIGHAEVPETKIDGRIARHLDRDDMVGTVLGAFCSVTIQCAQCHDHKFDPFTQEDYYSLQAVFAALDRADRRYDADPERTRRRESLERDRSVQVARQTQLRETVRRTAGDELAALERRIEEAMRSAKGNTRAEYGYHSAISATQEAAKWVQVDLGARRAFDRIVLRPCHDDFAGIGAGFGFPVRFRIDASDEPEFRNPRPIAARIDTDFPNPGTVPQSFAAKESAGRYVRVTVTKLAPRRGDYIFSLAELEVIAADGRNLAAGARVAALDSIEAPPRWRRENLVDGIAPAVDDAGDLAKWQAERDELVRRATDDATARTLTETSAALTRIDAELKSLPPADVVYAGTIHHGTGAFAGTGSSGGRPRPIFVLARGDVRRPLREVGPGTLAALAPLGGRFDLPPDHSEGARRAALAQWLVDPRHPLTWRSIVNRVWQHHFGRGLVETPGDFGRMGASPSHPELLDWLAADFRDHGGSLKRLHWQIATSAAYRQRSDEAQETTGAGVRSRDRRRSEAVDADNRFLWRQNRRKLEAEAVHDAVLAVAGTLDPKRGGPGYRDFVIESPAHSPHYEYHLADPSDPATWRRAVYRFVVRSQTQPFMTSLDCADPSMRVERRHESAAPSQALALLNDGFVVVHAARFADRLARDAGDDPAARVDRAFRLAFGRPPTTGEAERATAFARDAGLPSLCRVLLNLNEFVFVD